MAKLEDLIEKYRITSTAKYGAPEDPFFRNCTPWTVTLRFGRRRMTVPYYMGRGHRGAKPTTGMVLGSLLQEASIADSGDYADFCGEYGHELDDSRSIKIYKACVRISNRLHKFLGDAYEEFENVD